MKVVKAFMLVVMWMIFFQGKVLNFDYVKFDCLRFDFFLKLNSNLFDKSKANYAIQLIKRKWRKIVLFFPQTEKFSIQSVFSN